MTTMKIDTFREMEQQRAAINRHRENAARLARSYATWTTTGWGEFRVAHCFDFDCIFTEAPIFLTGLAVVDEDNEGVELVTGRFPGVTAGVWKWRLNENHYFTGAWVFFNVSTIAFQMTGGAYPTTPDPNYRLVHHMSFEGIALKDVPHYLLEL